MPMNITIPTTQAYLLPGARDLGRPLGRHVGLGPEPVLLLEALGRAAGVFAAAEVAEAVLSHGAAQRERAGSGTRGLRGTRARRARSRRTASRSSRRNGPRVEVAQRKRPVLLGPDQRGRQHQHHAEQRDAQIHHGEDPEVAQHPDVGGDQRREARRSP